MLNFFRSETGEGSGLSWQLLGFARLVVADESLDFFGLLFGSVALFRFLAMALAAEEVGTGRAVEAGADAAKLLFFVLSCFHSDLGE